MRRPYKGLFRRYSTTALLLLWLLLLLLLLLFLGWRLNAVLQLLLCLPYGANMFEGPV